MTNRHLSSDIRLTDSMERDLERQHGYSTLSTPSAGSLVRRVVGAVHWLAKARNSLRAQARRAGVDLAAG